MLLTDPEEYPDPDGSYNSFDHGFINQWNMVAKNFNLIKVWTLIVTLWSLRESMWLRPYRARGIK